MHQVVSCGHLEICLIHEHPEGRHLEHPCLHRQNVELEVVGGHALQQLPSPPLTDSHQIIARVQAYVDVVGIFLQVFDSNNNGPLLPPEEGSGLYDLNVE